jgi:hypothetical protein
VLESGDALGEIFADAEDALDVDFGWRWRDEVSGQAVSGDARPTMSSKMPMPSRSLWEKISSVAPGCCSAKCRNEAQARSALLGERVIWVSP